MSDPKKEGALHLVATPIGNLDDATVRSIATLQSADAIACEDTRITGKLLSKLEVPADGRLISYREQNEKTMAIGIADRIENGEVFALVSDAGMPAISDPGFRLVRECRRRGLTVSTAPGATAVTTALAISGLPSDGFLFVGFLPPKSAARKRFLTENQNLAYTIVLYESCHRILKLLNDLVEVLGETRTISVSRELTKLHETVHSGTAKDVVEKVTQGSQKGEFVVCIAKDGYAL